jgi:Na+-transporting methylmalonyl-CoA/oxaloacetate decarboxylase gamma subunit
LESGLAQPLWIALLGMVVTFAALGLLMGAMALLHRLARDTRPPAEPPDDRVAQVPSPPAHEPSEILQAAALSDEAAPVDLELPAGAAMDEVVAAVVAYAAARQLAQERRSARVWLSAQPRSLVSPWQLVARGWQMDRFGR